MSAPKLTESRRTCNVAEDAWSDPAWREAAREYHIARAGRRTLVEVEPGRKRLDVPQVMVEALMFSLREGVSALGQPGTLRRLRELSYAQLREVMMRVQKFKPEIAPAWTPEEVEALALITSNLHG